RGICCRGKSPLIPLPAYRRQVAKGEIGGFIEERFLPSVEMTIMKFNLTDKFTLGYLITVLIIILLFFPHISGGTIFVFSHLFVIGTIFFLIFLFENNPGNKIIKFFRFWYPPILYTFLYEETGRLNHIFFKENLDGFFQNIEFAIFKSQPSIWLAEKFSYIWLKECLHFFYFSYYLLVPILGFILYKKDLKKFCHFIFVTSFTFYFCYLIYIFLPVVGPLIWGLPKMEGKAFVPLMNFIYAYFEKPGAAFPSSHVAVALIVVFFAYKYNRKLFFFFLIDVIFLAIATVYCGFHYVIDVIAGIFTAVGCYYAGSHIYRRHSRLRGNDGLPNTSILHEVEPHSTSF
ncbi:MAG: phosphatase PAP2 family protein, partial [bacterium]